VHTSADGTTINLRKQENVWKEMGFRVGALVTLTVAVFFLSSEFQITNQKNILLAMDPSENLGLYWYVLTVMFNERIPFFRCMLFLMQLAMCIFVSQMIS